MDQIYINCVLPMVVAELAYGCGDVITGAKRRAMRAGVHDVYILWALLPLEIEREDFW